MGQTEQKTFFKVMKLVYNIAEDPIYQDEMLLLYEKLVNQLQKRKELQ